MYLKKKFEGKLRTGEDLFIYFYRGGINLLTFKINNQDLLDATCLTLKSLLALPCNVYAFDSQNYFLKSNQFNAQSCGFTSADGIEGKSLFDITPITNAHKIHANNQLALNNKGYKVFEEDLVRYDGISYHALTIKLPCYFESHLIGIFGFSILYDLHPVAESLEKLIALGWLNPFEYKRQHIVIKDIHLSKRESEICYYLIRGKTAKEIAEILALSKRTIEYYIENIKIKIKVTTKSELIDKLIDAAFPIFPAKII